MDRNALESAQGCVTTDPGPKQELPPQALLENTNEDTKRQIAEHFFGILAESYEPSSLAPFFDFYHKEVKRLHTGITPLVQGLHTKTHKDLMHIRDMVSNLRTEPRSNVRQSLHPNFATENDMSLDRLVDLTIRLWLMVNVRDDSLSMKLWTPGQFSARWDESDSLDTFLSHQFPPSTTKLQLKESRLEMKFTVAYMVRTCRLQVKWTDDLVNHLRLDRGPDVKTLSVFPHKDFLVAHLKNGQTNTRRRSVLPQKLVRETIMSLNMLFPQYDPATQALLREYGQTFDSVPPFEGPRKLTLREFSYWRDHLVDLHDVFQAEPDSWRQLFFDRRNPQQWWTFWIAMIIFFLSVASLGTSIVQVVI
ncbi:hypothetical protein Daus18300_000504 [Diaporthe australafricana]|uniref:Uncharacterized protein n=1 Tax=Diaporthe australafricana TaxID=127596 RepID=A0ABR3Y4N1_9PEZI